MWRRPERPPHTARFSCRRRGGVYAARERCGGPERCGPRKFARRGTTPPYGKREHGGNAGSSAFRQTSRAACRPPLRPNGNSQFSFFVRNLRKVVGRGLDPAAGTLRQTPRSPHTARFSCRRRGGVYAARERCGNPEHCGPRKFARRGTTRPTENGNTAATPDRPRFGKPPGRPAGRPYGRTEIRNFRFLFAIYGSRGVPTGAAFSTGRPIFL